MTLKIIRKGLAAFLGITEREAADGYDQVVEGIKDELRNDGECVIPGIGRLRVYERSGYLATKTDPRTGEDLGDYYDVEPRKNISFTPYKELKEAVNG